MITKIEEYNQDCIIEQIAHHFGVEYQTVDSQMLAGIINKMKLKDMNMLLANIAQDYFGYVLRNPSSGIGNWPNDTYFVGWYLADSDFTDYLRNNNIVLTFNSDTWWGEYGQGDATHAKCFVIDEENDVDGYITYTLTVYKYSQEDGKYVPDATFTASKFRTVNALTGEVDMLSRVDNDKMIFAAFNRYKFEFGTYETENSETGETITNYKVGESDIQWGRINVPDVNGDPYQYRESDVKYVILSNEAKEEYLIELAKNNNMPTSLETVINARTLEVYNSNAIQNAIDNMCPNDHLFAFVYNVSRVSIRYYEDGSREIVATYDNHINRVSDTCLRLEATGISVVPTPQKAESSNNNN